LRALIVLPILAKTLGEFYYGIWTQLIITITLLASVLTLRFDVTFVRFFSSREKEADIQEAFTSLLIIILTT
ncbi:MAG: flippase, partial [Calditrichae bacterium]|nr:flippase [Calditrichia bacterium]